MNSFVTNSNHLIHTEEKQHILLMQMMNVCVECIILGQVSDNSGSTGLGKKK